MGGMSGMTESEEERLFGDLPEEALAVVAELLSASEREEDRATGRRLEARRGFVLTAGPAAGGGLFAGLPQHPREIRRREPPNPARYAQIDAEDVRRWFADGGTFAQAMPGYESRPEQMRMAGDVAEAFSACRHLIVEAGTGVGKTMAYLVPAVLWSLSNDVPVVVSTNTKNLQDQIFRKDLPLIARMLRTPVRFALIKGRGNYLCLARLERLVDRREAEFGREELPALARAVAWAFRTATGDLSDFDPGPCGGAGEGGGPSVAERAASNAEDCRGRKCPYWSRCFLQKARADSLAADIVITNHAVFFSEPEDKPLALPRAAHVVFDEAHNLEEAATAKFAREASPWTVRRQLRRLHVPRRRRAEAAEDLAQGARHGLAREVLGGGLLEVVGLVEDDLGGLRERERPILGLGEEDGVVGDDDVRGEGVGAGLLQEAAAPPRALAAAAVVGVGGEALDGEGRGVVAAGGRAGVELREVARDGEERPRDGAGERGEVGGGELGLAAVEQAREAGEAEVVAAALHERETDGGAHEPRDEGQVLAEELVLEVLGVGAHDDGGVVGERPQRRGDEVGHRLADAGAGLDDEVAAGGERLGDVARHADLLRAGLVAGQRPREGAVGLEPAADVLRVEAPARGGARRGAAARLVAERRERAEQAAALARGGTGGEDERRMRAEAAGGVARGGVVGGGEQLDDDLHRLRGQERGEVVEGGEGRCVGHRPRILSAPPSHRKGGAVRIRFRLSRRRLSRRFCGPGGVYGAGISISNETGGVRPEARAQGTGAQSATVTT